MSPRGGPKEFWIWETNRATFAYRYKPEKDNLIHVVEYEAFKKLLSVLKNVVSLPEIQTRERILNATLKDLGL